MIIRLPRFSAGQRIVNDDGAATTTFLRYVNENASTVQAALNNLDQLTADLVATLAQANIALTTAQDVQEQAAATVAQAAITGSYVSPGDCITSAISTTDSTKATITIATHQRVYADAAGTTVTVSGATLTGLSLSTTYYITYTDAARHGGTVTYQARTDYLTATQGGNQHLVGAITTPASGATTPVTGGGTRPIGLPSWKADQIYGPEL